MNLMKSVKKILSDNKGNVALIFGISLMPIMLSIGAAVDYSSASNLRSKIASATDAALLAATATVMQEIDLDDTAAVNAKLNEVFEPFFLSNMVGANNFQYQGYTLSFDPATHAVQVNIDADYNTLVLKIAGIDSWEADVVAATNMQMKAGGAFSMFLVLDRSGSMGWSNGDGGTKMHSLKVAVDDMISNLQISDPQKKYIRMGAVAYNSHMWSEQKIRWNLNKANNYVQAMSAGGGTNSAAAVAKAYNELKKPREINKHNAKNGQVPELVMIFMTDGNNNHSSADTATLNTCTLAKNYGMKIYTVAFQAPAKGQALLSSCATDSAHYFEPDNTAELIQAFSAIGTAVGEKLVLTQ